jgi:hypothetical protein
VHGVDLAYTFYKGPDAPNVKNDTLAYMFQSYMTNPIFGGPNGSGGGLPRMDVYGVANTVLGINISSLVPLRDPAARRECYWLQRLCMLEGFSYTRYMKQGTFEQMDVTQALFNPRWTRICLGGAIHPPAEHLGGALGDRLVVPGIPADPAMHEFLTHEYKLSNGAAATVAELRPKIETVLKELTPVLAIKDAS